MTRQAKSARELLMWSSEPHPEWHDPDHPINRCFRRRDRDEDETENPSGRRAEPRATTRRAAKAAGL